LLLSGPAGPKDTTGIWTLSAVTGTWRMLGADAAGAVLSPDESHIAFFRDADIWIMKATGEDARMLFRVPPVRSHGNRLAWSPDGRRIAFATSNSTGDESGTAIESYDLETGRTSVIFADPKAEDFCWARDGRIIYSRLEDPPNEKSSNLWEVRVDPRTARARGTPRRLTNWEGFLLDSLGITADGKRFFFVRLRSQNNTYVGQLEDNGTRLARPKRFSYEQWTNWPTGWTRDSRAILFNSERHGALDIFRQGTDTGEVQALAMGQEEKRSARLSPDGRCILYLAWPRVRGRIVAGEGRLMRTGIAGGPPQTVTRVAGYSGPARIEPLVSLSAEGNPNLRCSSVPQAPCVLTEEVQDKVVFTAFDPVEGRRGELTRVAASSLDFWDLSPDGRSIALGTGEGRIRLVPLAGQVSHEIVVREAGDLHSVAWAADGKSLFVTGWMTKGGPLLHVSLDGKARLLYRGTKYVENPAPSPNGRYLAWGETTIEGNAWVMDTPR